MGPYSPVRILSCFPQVTCLIRAESKGTATRAAMAWHKPWTAGAGLASMAFPQDLGQAPQCSAATTAPDHELAGHRAQDSSSGCAGHIRASLGQLCQSQGMSETDIPFLLPHGWHPTLTWARKGLPCCWDSPSSCVDLIQGIWPFLPSYSPKELAISQGPGPGL